MKNPNDHIRHGLIPDPGPISSAIFDIPGFVSAYQLAAYASDRTHNAVLAFSNAIAMLAYLSARNYYYSRVLYPNLGILACLGPGQDANWAKLIRRDFESAIHTLDGRYVTDVVDDAIGLHYTSEDFADFAKMKPANFFFMENAELMFARRPSAKVPAGRRKIAGDLRALHEAILQSTQGDVLTFLGILSEEDFLKNTAEAAMDEGLLAQCLFIDAGPGNQLDAYSYEVEFPKSLLDSAYFLAARADYLDPDHLPEARRTIGAATEPILVQESPEAKAKLETMLADFAKNEKSALSEAEKTLWRNAPEKVFKLALIYAISADIHSPQITPEGAEWARKFVDLTTRRFIYLAAMHIYRNDFDRLKDKAVERLRKYGDGELPRGRFMQYMHLNKDELDVFVDELYRAGVISVRPLAKGGVLYKLRD